MTDNPPTTPPAPDLATVVAAYRQAADLLDTADELRDYTDDHMGDINEAAEYLRRCAAELHRTAEHQPAAAPRNALSAPHTAEHPTPGPERHPGGENGPHTGTQRAELCRQFKAAITRRWDVGPFVVDEIVDDAVDCHLDLVARATAELRAELAIDTQVMEKADRECDEHIAAGRAFRQLAERTQAWGEQHRDRANRYRARVDRVRALHVRNQNTGHCEHCSERDYPDYAVPHPCPTIRALDAPQAGDDTTGDTP